MSPGPGEGAGTPAPGPQGPSLSAEASLRRQEDTRRPVPGARAKASSKPACPTRCPLSPSKHRPTGQRSACPFLLTRCPRKGRRETLGVTLFQPPLPLSSQALLSRCLGAEELGPWLPRFSSHRAAPVGVTSSDQRAAPRPRVTRGAAGWSVLSGCPSHRHEGEGKLLVALTLNRDLDRRRGFRGSCPPGLSGTGWGLFPRPAHVAGVRGEVGVAKHLTSQSSGLGPDPRESWVPQRPGGPREGLARVLEFSSRMWESATGVPRPLWRALRVESPE